MNPYRGEVAVELAGRPVTLRATFEALARIEGETGAGAFALARRLEALLKGEAGEVRASEVAAVLAAGIGAAEGRQPAKEEIGELIAEARLIHAASAAYALLVRALVGRKGGEAGPSP